MTERTNEVIIWNKSNTGFVRGSLIKKVEVQSLNKIDHTVEVRGFLTDEVTKREHGEFFRFGTFLEEDTSIKDFLEEIATKLELLPPYNSR
jgi:hypothetical protein